MLPSNTGQLPDAAPVGGALSVAMTSYSTWMLDCPAEEIALVMRPPSRVHESLLLEAPVPVEAIFPSTGSQKIVPGDNVPDCQVAKVQPLAPEAKSLLSTVSAGGRGVAAA